MTKQKTSFLDKIAGRRENEEDNEKRIEVENDNEEIYDSKDDLNGKEEERKFEDKQEKRNEEWAADKESGKEEGQLTIDVYQTEDLIVIKSIIGGVRPEDLDISITVDMITIKGTRINPDEVEADDYYYQECFWGCFSRSIILPCDVKAEKVEATMKNGILTVKLPKIEKNSSMKIAVKEEQ